MTHPVIRAQSSFHHLNSLEALFALWIRNDLLHVGSDSQYTCLRWVDDGGKVAHAEHAQIRDGESAALVLVRLELVVPCFLDELFCRGRNAC